jgi:GcrA cell cycle regulator
MRATKESYDWNDEAISRLRSLWDEGHAAAEIGRRLGVSKSAVIGKAHRLHLPARPSPVRRQPNQTGPRPPPQRAPAPTLAEMVPVRLAASTSGPPEAATRPDPAPPQSAPTPAEPGTANTCCWPIGDPGTPTFRFCGNPALATRPYCAEHAAIAYCLPGRRGTATPTDAQAD